MVLPAEVADLLVQLRSMTCETVECLSKWRARHSIGFMWNSRDYMLQMYGDLNFLSVSRDLLVRGGGGPGVFWGRAVLWGCQSVKRPNFPNVVHLEGREAPNPTATEDTREKTICGDWWGLVGTRAFSLAGMIIVRWGFPC